MNYKNIFVLLGMLLLPHFAVAQSNFQGQVSQQVQQTVMDTRFGEVNVLWETAVVEGGHFRINNKKMNCSAVQTQTAVLVPSHCFLPANNQGILLPKGNVLLQQVSWNSAQGRNRVFRPVFEKLSNGYIAVLDERVGLDGLEAEQGRLYTVLRKNRNVRTMYSEAVKEGDLVFAYGGDLAASFRGDMQLEKVYFQDEDGKKTVLNPQYTQQGRWTILSVEDDNSR